MGEINYKDAKIVVIDDKDFVLESIKEALEFEDMQVKTFQNPKEGLEYLKENKADVLLLDYYMPEMNGGELVDELRKFNNETIIILQTGFANDIPPLEMMDNLNIQGYVDKNEGSEKVILATKSAIKTAKLTKKIRQQEKQIDALQYKDEFFGSFVNLIIEEINNKTMTMSGSLLVMEQDEQYIPDHKKEEYNKFVVNARQSISELSELSKSIDIGIEKISVERFKKVITRLLKMDLIVFSSTLNFSIENEYIILDCDPKILVYIVMELIRYLVKQKINPINISAETEENHICLKILHNIEDCVLLNKINKLATLDKQINILNEDNHIIIKICDVEKE